MLPSMRNPLSAGLWLFVILSIPGCVGLLEPEPPLGRHGAPFSRPDADRGGSTAVLRAASPVLFYPLDLGNHWTYARTFSVQIVPVGAPPEPPRVFRSTMDADLVGTKERFGREYVVQLETYH